MKTRSLFIGAIILGMSFASCKKTAGPEGPAGPTGPGGPVLTGNLKGFVAHFDLSGAKVTTNLAGDSVTIDNTSLVSVTDVNGEYSFSGLTTGVYNLTVKRAGYGWTKIQSVQFTGGGDTYRNANISKIPATNVNTFMAYDTTINAINYIRFRGTITAAAYPQSIIGFVGVPGNSTCNSASTNQTSYYVINVNANATTFARNVQTAEFYDLGYVSTNTAYFAVYMIGGNTNASAYGDLTNNKTIFTAISATPLLANALVQ